MQRFRVELSGQVQGVGFRPHVWQTAHKLQLTGWVQNTPAGVLIEVQGKNASCFFIAIHEKLPKLAKIDALDFKVIPIQIEEESFSIIRSKEGVNQTIIVPDSTICQNCLEELFDPDSRYYHYPFLNCVECGPRLSICKSLPYDRQSTSMDVFDLCEACLHEYKNPANRRYHAQPTACAQCGPKLSQPIDEVAKHIQSGKIIALKSLGGYQLICDARNKSAVLALRERKHRNTKPFAIMVLNTKSAEQFVTIDSASKQQLEADSRPIVLLPSVSNELSEYIAPELNHLGIMLPSTPIHYLLFDRLSISEGGTSSLENSSDIALVVTSANLSGQPLFVNDKSAHTELTAIADIIVSYNRNIVTRLDDSVIQLVNQKPIFLRRARGFVPRAIKLAYAIPETIALGGHLKNTLCVTRDNKAYLSQHIGNMDTHASIEFYHETLEYMLRFLAVTPQRVACDLHPDFYTTQLAHTFDLPCYPIQHHQAHLQAVMAEHHVTRPILGLVLDGYGYGERGESWGGELFLVEQTQSQRIGHFQPLLQPGGEVAIRQPWRMAAGVLASLGKHEQITRQFRHQPQANDLRKLLEQESKLPFTTSCGRLFDAVSALLGIVETSHYEAQAAMQLESMVSQTEVMPEGWFISDYIFSLIPLLDYLSSVKDPEKGANLFHGTLIAGLSEWVVGIARERHIDAVLLSGGCFSNKVLSQGLLHSITQAGIACYLPHQSPINDGGLSLGQAWMAGRL